MTRLGMGGVLVVAAALGMTGCSKGDPVAECKAVMVRASACMDPAEATGKVVRLDPEIDEAVQLMCGDAKLQRDVAWSVKCLDEASCADFRACFREKSPVEAAEDLGSKLFGR